MPALSSQFLQTLKPQSRLAVAVSGGGDSVALLKLLHAKLGPQRLVVLHFNHNLRPDADGDQAWVEQLCTTLQIPCLHEVWTTPPTTNQHQAARRARYTFFTETVQQLNLAGVCVAHTRDDIAETLLMRLGRGSGVQGLSAMQTVTQLGHLTVFRPLLHVCRGDLRQYLKDQNQIWLEDPTNQNTNYLRPRVRQGIATLAGLGLPSHAITDAAVSIQRANEALNFYTQEFMSEHITQSPNQQEVIIDINLFHLPEEVAQRVIEQVILQLKPNPLAPRLSKRLRMLENLKHSETHATLGGVKFEKTHLGLICSALPEPRAPAISTI